MFYRSDDPDRPCADALDRVRGNADRRVALVIGNSAYSNAASLRNPRNDASDMADTLKKLGFEVQLGLEPRPEKFRQHDRELRARARRSRKSACSSMRATVCS